MKLSLAELLLLPVTLAAAVTIPVMFEALHGQVVLFFCLLLVYCAMSLSRPVAGAVMLLVFQAFQSELRRYSGSIFGFGGSDPLILISPISTLCLLFVLIIKGYAKADTRLAKWIYALLIFMAVEIFNPLQGGLSIGFAGAMFYMIPILWYWVGKAFGDDHVLRFVVLKIFLPIALLAALLGLWQTFFGYLPYEQAWLAAAGWDKRMSLGGLTRAVAFLSSPAEYARFLTLGVVIIWAIWLHHRSALALLLPVLFSALYLESGRGPIFLSVFAMGALWAAMGRKRGTWVPRAILAVAIGAAGIYFGAGETMDAAKGTQAEQLIAHQAQGLSNPLDEKKSTGKIHFGMFMWGISEGFTMPIGHGLGTTTMASTKFGGQGGSTELDISDMFVSLGAVGGIVFCIILLMIFRQALQFWAETRQLSALIILGALIASLGNVLMAGDYAKTPFLWFLIGALDRINGAWDMKRGSEQIARRRLAPINRSRAHL